jgi:hypothetical protein
MKTLCIHTCFPCFVLRARHVCFYNQFAEVSFEQCAHVCTLKSRSLSKGRPNVDPIRETDGEPPNPLRCPSQYRTYCENRRPAGPNLNTIPAVLDGTDYGVEDLTASDFKLRLRRWQRPGQGTTPRTLVHRQRIVMLLTTFR